MTEGQSIAARAYGQIRGVWKTISELLVEARQERAAFHGLLELDGGIYLSPDDLIAGLLGYQDSHGPGVTMSDILVDETQVPLPKPPEVKPRKLDGLVTLQLTVAYDRGRFDAERICEAVDTVLETALSTPDILADVGNPSVSPFEVAIGDDVHFDDDEDEEEEENTVTCRVCGQDVPDYDASSAPDGEGSICHRCAENEEHGEEG